MRSISEFVAFARQNRQNHQYEKSGEYYSLAFYAYLTASWDDIRTHDLKYLQKGGLFQSFVWSEYAVTCYTLADAEGRAENRVDQSLSCLEDARNNLIDHDAWIGLSWELEADLRLMAGYSGVEEAYKSATDRYREVEANCNEGEILSWTTEPGFNEAISFVVAIVEGVEREIEFSELRMEDGHPSLGKRLEFKRRELRGILAQIESQGKWHWKDHDLPTIEDDRTHDDSSKTDDD